MQDHLTAWRWAWGAIAIAGLAMAAVLWSPIELLFFLGLGAVLGTGVVVCLAEEQHGRPAVRRQQLVAGGLTGALALAGSAAWMHISTEGGLSLAALAGLTSPWVAEGVRRFVAEREVAEVAVGGVGGVGGVPTSGPGLAVDGASRRELDERSCASFTTVELCLAWRETFAVLESSTDAGERMWVLAVREALLDELERRHPEGVQRWLTSGTPAHVAPLSFFASGPPDVSPAGP